VNQLVDLPGQGETVGDRQPIQTVPRRLGYLNGCHGHTDQYPQQLIPRDLTWPPQGVRRDDWRRLITWDGVLRPDEPALNP
jgi:hypothetical protein